MPRKAKAEKTPDTQVVDLLKGVAGQLASVTERLDKMEAKVNEQAAATPRIIPRMEANLGTPDTSSLRRVGDEAQGSKTLPCTATGQRVMYRQWPLGTRVKLNTEKVALHHGKRRVVFDPETVGEVVGFHFYSETRDEGKYRVRFPGLTSPRGDGFYESDLIPV